MTNYNLHNDCKKLSQRIYPENRHIDTNGWSYKGVFSNHRSGFYAEVYTKGDKAILVFRGTQLTIKEKEAMKDGRSDINMGLEKLPHQIQDAEIAYQKTVDKYGKDNVILTGHSLGGSEAQILGAKYGAETVTFGAYGTKFLDGIEINYIDNITNYGDARDGIFVKNIDGQIGKTVVLIDDKSGNGYFKKEYDFQDPLNYHRLENYGDLSKGVEYKQSYPHLNESLLFKLRIEKNNDSSDKKQSNKTSCVGSYPVSGYTRSNGVEVKGYTRHCGAKHLSSSGKNGNRSGFAPEQQEIKRDNDGCWGGSGVVMSAKDKQKVLDKYKGKRAQDLSKSEIAEFLRAYFC